MTAIKKFRELWRRLSFYFRRERFDRELDDEMRFHLEMKARAKMQDGVQSKDAQLAAIRQFGNQVRLKERSREMWTIRWIETTIKDLKYSLRMIRKSPVFATVVILSLALAIGVNTAIFSLVDATLLKSLPVKNPNELVLFGWSAKTNAKISIVSHSGNWDDDPKTGMTYGSSLSAPMFEHMKQQNQTLTDLFAFSPIYTNLNVSIDNQAKIATGQLVTGGYYKGLGVRPIIGRSITDEDDKPGAPLVAVLTYDCWKELYGLDPSILNKNAFINGLPFTIVGVTQPGFVGASDIDRSIQINIPLVAEQQIYHKPADNDEDFLCFLRVMGRLKPGISIEQARANLEPVVQAASMEGLREALAKYPNPELNDAVPPNLTAMSGSQGEMYSRRDYAKQLYVLLIVVGLVLLIACVNVANLLLARSGARQREIAVRIALGAGRLRLLRQLLTESLVLAVAGGLCGFLLAYLTRNSLAASSLFQGQSLNIDMSLDLRVLGFTTAVSLMTGILFGIAPALKATRIDPGPALKENAAAQGFGRSKFSMGKSLIIIQVALSIVLLIGATLFLQTLRNLQHVDYGFDAQNILLFDVNPSLNGYKGERLGNIYKQIAERLDTVPGVKSATISLYPLLKGWGWGEGTPKVPGAKKIPDEKRRVYLFPIRDNFLQTMQIPLLAGREFDARDNANSQKVAIVNQEMVKYVFDDDVPIGQHFQLGSNENAKVYEVVGIVKDTLYHDLRDVPQPIIYFPYGQQMQPIEEMGEGMTFEVKTFSDPINLVPAVREAVRSVDSTIPILNVKTQTQQIDESLRRERVFAKLTGALGLLVLVLAGLGLYGVMSYNVTRRTREIGIRMALGAGSRRILTQVMRETLVLVAIGTALGIGASYAVTKFVRAEWIGIDDRQSMLFGVSPHDPTSIALAAVFLLLVAAFAGYLPARRATKVDPNIALRFE